MSNNSTLNADTMSAKRVYQTPTLRVVSLRNTSIIATSDTQQSQTNEALVEGSTNDWKF